MLRRAADGGDGAEVPAVALDRLDTTAATLIDDMEDKEQIPDRCTLPPRQLSAGVSTLAESLEAIH